MTAGHAGALFVATHIPRLAVAFGVGTTITADKLLHLTAYGVLGFWWALLPLNPNENYLNRFRELLPASLVFHCWTRSPSLFVVGIWMHSTSLPMLLDQRLALRWRLVVVRPSR